MPEYIYTAYDGEGRRIVGRIEAADENTAVSMLKRQGLIVIGIKKARPSILNLSYSFKGRKIGDRQLAVISRQLASLLGAGIPLVDALGTLKDEYTGVEKAVLQEVYNGIVRDNLSFAEAVRKTQAFPKLFVSLMRVAEETGSLDTTLVVAAEFYEKRAAIREKIRSAMMYPILVLLMSVAAIAVFLLVVIPKIRGIYSALHGELPFITRFLIATSEWLTRNWLWILLVLAIMWMAWRISMTKIPVLRLAVHKFILKIPVIGRINLLGSTLQSFKAFQILFKSGVPVLDAVTLAAEVSTNDYLKKHLLDVRDKLETGKSISDAIAETPFPKTLKTMIRLGENAGSLDDMLERYLELAEYELETSISKMIKLLEPISTIIVGSVVLLILLAMYLPIFSLSTLIKR